MRMCCGRESRSARFALLGSGSSLVHGALGLLRALGWPLLADACFGRSLRLAAAMAFEQVGAGLFYVLQL